jgi:hypothetical protein
MVLSWWSILLAKDSKVSNNEYLADLSCIESHWELAVRFNNCSVTVVPGPRQELVELLDLMLGSIDHLVDCVVIVWQLEL